MRTSRRTKLLVEPPSSATGDIAFNLIVFFLVCASVQPDSGRLQVLPASETVDDKQQQTENIEVQLTRTAVLVNGDAVLLPQFEGRIRSLLAQRSSPDQKVVIVKSRPDTPYHHWIRVTAAIEDAGGMITLQLEEEREVVVP